MRQKINDFEDLIVWQKAHELVLMVYKETVSFPKHELYGIVSQMRRSAASIPANIAEGFRKRTKAEKCRYLTIAHGSLSETRYFMILSRDLEYCVIDKMMALANEVGKLLTQYYNKTEQVYE